MLGFLVFMCYMEMVEAGYVAPGVVFVDGTHTKANANTKKAVKKEVPVAAKRYAKELMEEVNADREAHGKKPLEPVESDYVEMAEDARCTPICQKMYMARKETIERIFADAKEQHGMRYTRFIGLAQVRNWVKLKFAAMNLKKYATRLWKDTRPGCVTYVLSLFLPGYVKSPCFA